jgi:acetylserotonin N-methyltransferase
MNDAQPVLDLMDGFRASKALFTAVSLRLFDRLHGAPSTCAALADALNCAPHALERLLGACAGLGLLSVSNGTYANTDRAARYLRVASAESLCGYILYSDRLLYRLWGHLGDAVRDGTHRWEQTFGTREGIFDAMFATDEDKHLFLAGMHGLGLLSSPAVVAAVDLSRFTVLVDLGGASGHLAVAACRRHPHLRAIVFDLPKVVPFTRRHVEEAGLGDRIEVQAGDFFDSPLPAADLYAVARVLHDWTDDKVIRLLTRIHDHLPPGGGLLVCEKLLSDAKDGPAHAMLQSLSMLVCTEGRERSPTEYRRLLETAGFESFEYALTGQPVDAMLVRKGTL